MLTVLPSSRSFLQPLAMSIVCMNLRAIAVLKNSRDCVLSPSSIIFFFSLNSTFERVRVRMSTAGLLPLAAWARTSRAIRSIFASVTPSRSVFVATSFVFFARLFAAIDHSRSSSWPPVLRPLRRRSLSGGVFVGGWAAGGAPPSVGPPLFPSWSSSETRAKLGRAA